MDSTSQSIAYGQYSRKATLRFELEGRTETIRQQTARMSLSILTTMGPLFLKSIPPRVPASRDGFSVPDLIPPCPVSV